MCWSFFSDQTKECWSKINKSNIFSFYHVFLCIQLFLPRWWYINYQRNTETTFKWKALTSWQASSMVAKEENNGILFQTFCFKIFKMCFYPGI
ncbi:hypothetical protein D3C87_1676920 [compost metagenome]